MRFGGLVLYFQIQLLNVYESIFKHFMTSLVLCVSVANAFLSIKVGVIIKFGIYEQSGWH